LGATAKSTWNHLRGEPFQQTLEGGHWVLISAIVMQCYSQAVEQLVLIASWVIEIPEKRGVWGNAEPIFTHHAKTANGSNSVRMQVDQLASYLFQDSYQKFTRRKIEFTYEM
jgi:hypothetical protein